MSRPRKRVLIFLGALALITALVQWHHLPALLDSPLGIHWSEGLVDFLKTNTEGLVLLFVITIFFEFVGLERSLEQDRQRERALNSLLDASLSSSSNNALLHYALGQQFGDQAASDLARYIAGGDELVLNDFFVSIRVAPSGQGFRVEIVLQYKAALERYVVGMTSESRDIEPMTIARVVTETFVVPNGQATILPNTPGSPVSVEATSVGGTDGGNMAPLSFKPLSAKRRKSLLKQAGITRDPASCQLFEADPMRDLALTGAVADIQYRAALSIEKQESYTFWASDRPLYVRSIEVDLSALPQEQIEAADVNLFVGNVGWAPFVTGTGGRWSFPLDRWLVAGHGIMAAWPSVQ